MQATSSYFARMDAMEQELRRHGFDSWPSEEDLLRYLMDTNDRVDAVCAALGMVTAKDVRGRWLVYASRPLEVV